MRRSAAVANSKNVRNTNAGSAASNSNSDSSRINSPSAVSSSNSITTTTQVPVECIYNTGSPNDEGYAQGYHDGYNDGFNDGKIGVNKDHC
jgi:hypothetical protein